MAEVPTGRAPRARARARVRAKVRRARVVGVRTREITGSMGCPYVIVVGNRPEGTDFWVDCGVAKWSE